MTPDAQSARKSLRAVVVVLVSILIVFFIFRLTEAGSLTPSAGPASTMRTLEDIFAPLVSSGYDSSTIVASKSGNAFQVTKCIILKMTGGTPCL